MSHALLFRVGVLTVAVFCIAEITHAGFVPGFVGSSEFVIGPASPPAIAPPTAADGLVNFAVYRNDGSTGNWVTDLGIFANALPIVGIGAGVDVSANYVYFYQLVNTSPIAGDDILNLLQIPGGSLGATAFTGGGYLTTALGGSGVVFDEAGTGATGTLANPSLSSVATSTTASGTNATNAKTVPLDPDFTPGDGVPGNSGGVLDTTPFAADASAIIADTLKYLGFSNLYEFHTSPPLDIVTTASPDQLTYTTVLYLTANSRPTYLPGNIHDGTFTTADIPSVTPEAGTMLMAFASVMCGLVFNLAVRRKSA